MASDDGDGDKDNICYDVDPRDIASQDNRRAEKNSERQEVEHQTTEKYTQAHAMSTSGIENIAKSAGKSDGIDGTRARSDSNEIGKEKARPQEPEERRTHKTPPADVNPCQEGGTDSLCVVSVESPSPNLEPAIREAQGKGTDTSGNQFTSLEPAVRRTQDKDTALSGNPFAVDQGTAVMVASLSMFGVQTLGISRS